MQTTYTLAEVTQLLGLSRAVISGLVAAGFVAPARGPRREYRFSFQDLVLLRAAQGLRQAQIAPRRIVRSLKALREKLPERMPLAGLRLAAIGNEIVVREGGGPWRADSGQWLLDFGAEQAAAAPRAARDGVSQALQPPCRAPAPPAAPAAPAAAPRAPRSPPAPRARAMAASDAWFQRAVDLETHDPAGAEAAYRHAIAAAPRRTEAYLNLGVLLGEAGRHAEAAAVARLGIERCTPEPLLHYNLAVALEDAGQPAAAVAAYEHCLALDPRLADAHFNLARLHDQRGQARQAIRHYSAYRRLRHIEG
jgi:tetratricopeptide (TPR) repeat protein